MIDQRLCKKYIYWSIDFAGCTFHIRMHLFETSFSIVSWSLRVAIDMIYEMLGNVYVCFKRD